MRTGQIGAATLLALLFTGCGGEDPANPDARPTSATASEQSAEPPAPEPDDEETDDGTETAVGDACALLDPAVLNDLMEGETTILGSPYEFQDPLTQGPSAFCAWKETSTGLDLQVTLEPSATSAIDDHSGRAYNIDVDPVPVPQDGPGTSAVLLTDPAFAEEGDENFAYGYFYVSGEVTVFVKSVGLDLGADRLRAIADETADRVAAE